MILKKVNKGKKHNHKNYIFKSLFTASISEKHQWVKFMRKNISILIFTDLGLKMCIEELLQRQIY